VALPAAAVEDAIERTGTRERRRRVLPTHLVVTLVVGMGLWAAESRRHVLAEVVEGWREVRAQHRQALRTAGPHASRGGRRARGPWRLPSTPALVQARQRVARAVPGRLHAIAGPIAMQETGAPSWVALRRWPPGRRRAGRGGHARQRPRLRRRRPPRPARFPRCGWWRSSRRARPRSAPVLRPFRGATPPRATCCGRSAQAGCCGGTGLRRLRNGPSHAGACAHFWGTTATVVLPVERVLPDGAF
jgi:hypothetical protein